MHCKSFLTAYYNRKKKNRNRPYSRMCFFCSFSYPIDKCPVDNLKLSVMVKNIAVSEQVGELLIHCRYGCKLLENGEKDKYEVDPEGCPFTFPLKDRRWRKSSLVLVVFVFFFNVKDNLFTHVNDCFINACFDSVKTIDTGLNLRSYLNNCRTLYTKEIKIHERVNFICKMKSTFGRHLKVWSQQSLNQGSLISQRRKY